jgi:hypothetical protein
VNPSIPTVEDTHQQPKRKQSTNEEQDKPAYPIIEELAPATEEDFAYWETEEAWEVEEEGYDILGFPIRDTPPES